MLVGLREAGAATWQGRLATMRAISAAQVMRLATWLTGLHEWNAWRMKPSEFAISLASVQAAHERIANLVVRTPLVHSERLSIDLDCQVHLKCENLQHIGAFKARGATNAVLELSSAAADLGVVTHSSGNHAAALARAASLRGITAHIVMPENSARNKIEAVRSYGVEPVFCEPTAQARESTAEQVRLQSGATLVHPYNDASVMAGQGTVGLEIVQQLPEVDVILVPVGGGGLLSGILVAVKAVRPETQVIAVEPQWADDAARSLQAGSIQQPTRYDTMADGLRTPLADKTFPIIRELLDDIILVGESEIAASMRILAEQVHVVAEPSGAVTLAGLRSRAKSLVGRRVAVVISGGNLDFGQYSLGGSPDQ